MNLNVRNSIIEDHYLKYYKTLVKQISHRLGNNPVLAEDVVMEAYSRALKYFRVFNPSLYTFSAWFTNILNNTLRDIHRQERMRGVNIPIADVEHLADPINVAYQNAVQNDILASISKDIEKTVNAVHKEILDLFFIHGLSPNEISEIINNSTENYVRLVVSRFRPFLRDKYHFTDVG